MLTASSDFDLTIGKTVQRVVGALTVDLPITTSTGGDFTANLVAVQLDAQNETDLPDGIRDQVGFSTIGGSITIGGRYSAALSIADLFNPDNPASPLWRLKVKGRGITFAWGVRPSGKAAEALRKLTGRITGYTLNHADGTVALNVVDLTVDWSAAPETSAVVTAPPYNAGLTTEFAMDSLIRSVNGGVSSWPAQRAQCVLAVGMRSSLWPEVGSLGTAGPQAIPTFAPGPLGTGLASVATVGGGYIQPMYVTSSPVARSLFIGFWIKGITNAGLSVGVGNSMAGPSNADRVALSVSASHLTLILADGSTVATGDWATPIDGGAHFVGLSIGLPAVGSGAYTGGTLYLDGQTQAISAFTYATPRTTAAWSDVDVTVRGTGSEDGSTLAAVQITTESSPVADFPFTPAAVLDPSLNPLTVVPPIPAGTSAADVLKQMAAAELGYARRDENGIFRFSNRRTLAQQAVSRTITSAVSLKQLTTEVGNTTEYNHVQVPYTDWTFGAPTAVYTQTGVKKLPKRTTTVWRQTLDTVVAALDTTVLNLPNLQSPTDGNSWSRVSSDAAGKNEHPGVTITVRQVTSSVIEITAINNTNVDGYLVAPSTYSDTIGVGTPSLWIGGTPATPADEALVDVTIGDGSSVFTVTSNPYLQDADTARDVGYFILNQVMAAVRDFTSVAIVPDSRIQIGDKQFLADDGLSKIREYVTVWGWSFNATFPAPGESGGTWEQQLNLRAVGPPGAWIGGVAGRSEGDLTTWGY